MQRKEVIEKISKIVDDNLGYNVPTNEEIFSKSSIDSLDMLSIIMEIEGEFGIEVSDALVEEIATERLSVEGLADKLLSKYEI